MVQRDPCFQDSESPGVELSFAAFAKWYPFRYEIRPFTFGLALTWFLVGPMTISRDPVKKAESKYATPPKHH